MGYVPLRPPGAVRLPPRSPASKERAGANCASCGAPVHLSEHRCAWCLTPNPNWQWRTDDAIEVTTLQDTQRVFVSAHPIDERALDDLRRQWFEQHSRPGAIVAPPERSEPTRLVDWALAALWLCFALAPVFIIF